MYRIKTLTLQNFKFFCDKVHLNFDRKNVLLYGENGSGKSSVYWALYTFFQSVFKLDNAEIEKYFNLRHNENLLNRFAADDSVSFIEVEFEDGHNNVEVKKISLSNITTKTGDLVKEATLGSDFLDYKVLSKIYAYYHKEEINLFDFFYHELFAFINFREELNGSKNAETWWQYIEKGLSPKPKMHEPIYKKFQADITKFNTELKYYITNIQQLTNDHLEQRLKEKFRIRLTYQDGTYNDFKPGTKGRSWKIKPPQIILSVELMTDLITEPNKKIIDSPQSFLNEAKLSSIALAMRLAILDEKYVKEYPKVLVLDDLLISMDMSNREFILSILFDNYLPDYQILFFTHQRGLFEDARVFIENHYAEKVRAAGETNKEVQKNAWQKEWMLMEMFEAENINGIPIPHIVPHESSLQKALKYFKYQIDYNACGNNLRAALEEFFLDFIPHKFQKNGNMIAGLLVDAKSYFTHIGFDTAPIDKLERYRERSLNPTSHYNPRADYFKRELKEIFSILESLKNNRNEAILRKDDKIKFDIQSQSGTVFGYTAILLDDISLYKKNDGTASFFKETDERGYVMIGFTENNSTKLLNSEIRCCTLKALYDDTVKFINRGDISIEEADMFSVFKNEIGESLNELKFY
jgi:Recombinational DNA repair ATPase (RecF pathway)